MSMLGFGRFLALFRDAIKNDDAIAAWCQAEFGKALSIFVGIDQRNPPGPDQCPLAIIQPDHAVDGDGLEERVKRYTLEVQWAVSNEATASSGGVTELAGLAQVDRLGQLIWDALADCHPNLELSSADIEVEPVAFFPMVVAGAAITINVPVLISAEISFD
ncbi:MAG: hypothetical protein ACOZHQ_09455 [Thermodesulfobacteriota bacterium]